MVNYGRLMGFKGLEEIKNNRVGTTDDLMEFIPDLGA